MSKDTDIPIYARSSTDSLPKEGEKGDSYSMMNGTWRIAEGLSQWPAGFLNQWPLPGIAVQ